MIWAGHPSEDLASGTGGVTYPIIVYWHILLPFLILSFSYININGCAFENSIGIYLRDYCIIADPCKICLSEKASV